MRVFTYIDTAKLLSEGQRLAAVQSLARDIADAGCLRITESLCQVDYGTLHRFLCGVKKSHIGGARLWGSPPQNDTYWELLDRSRFSFAGFDEAGAGNETRIACSVTQTMTKDAYTMIRKHEDELILVAADPNYEPVIRDFVAEGFRICVAFWGHAPKELKTAASDFLDLDPYFGHLTTTVKPSDPL